MTACWSSTVPKLMPCGTARAAFLGMLTAPSATSPREPFICLPDFGVARLSGPLIRTNQVYTSCPHVCVDCVYQNCPRLFEKKKGGVISIDV